MRGSRKFFQGGSEGYLSFPEGVRDIFSVNLLHTGICKFKKFAPPPLLDLRMSVHVLKYRVCFKFYLVLMLFSSVPQPVVKGNRKGM